MLRRFILTKKILSSFFLMVVSVQCYCFTLDGTLAGNDLKFRNITDSTSGDYTISDWTPSKNLFPASSWSPGFLYKKLNAVLISKNGSTHIDISDAIDIIGMEYRAYNDLNLSSVSLSGIICPKGGHSGNTAFAIDNGGRAPCHAQTFKADGKMPFYFMRPIFTIDSSKIKDAFSSLPIKERKEGIYSFSTPLVLPYFFKMVNGVETWQNIVSILNISINYKPGFISDIRLKDPTAHEIEFESSDGDTVKGSTKFTVIADGMMPEGLTLTIPSVNDFNLYNTDSEVKNPKIPISIVCPDCLDEQLVNNGIPQVKDTVVNLSGSHLEFPIYVKLERNREDISLGDYQGNFVLNFALNL
ncbi:TPA: hypothetical protein ACX6RT_003778 [Photobacterium damselae]